MAQPSASSSPLREEEVPDVQAPNTINVAQVGDVLRDFMNGFLATLAQTVPSTTQRARVGESERNREEPPINAQVERRRGVPQTTRVPNASLNRRNPIEATPVINVPDVNDDLGV